MGVTQLYTTTTNGYVMFRGNTLVINNSQGTTTAFISLNSENTSGTGFPAGTTTSWQSNGSFSEVHIPTTATVLYAALVWNMFDYDNTMPGQPAIWDTPISFNTPKQTLTISPDPKFSGLVNMVDSYLFYTRGADVTDLVREGGSGNYSIAGVPGVINPFNLGNGWTLAIVLKDNTHPIANMSIWLTIEGIDIVNSKNNTFALSTIYAEGTAPLNTRVLLSGSWGDTEALNSILLNDTALHGSKNLLGNFMCSQIVDEFGNYYNASFSNNNTPVGEPRTAFARASYDITNVNGTGLILPGATSANITQLSNTDAFTFNIMGLQVDSAMPVSMNKSIDKAFADIGDILTYTIKVSNNGSLPVSNAIFTDNIPSNTSFMNNSFTINGEIKVNANPVSGVTIDSIPVNNLITITFKVVVLSIPDINPASNTASITYEYATAPNESPKIFTSFSNEASFRTNSAVLQFIKKVNKSAAALGDKLTFSFQLTNIGNVPALNMVFKDTIPLSTNFIEGSFKINGETQLGVDPSRGVTIGLLDPNHNLAISFDINTISMPSPPKITNNAEITFNHTVDPNSPFKAKIKLSNSVETEIKAKLTITKGSDKDAANKGDIITFNSLIKNNSCDTVTDVFFIDVLPQNIEIIPNSFKVNDEVILRANPNTGVNIGNIGGLNIILVSFQVKVKYINSPPVICNTSTVKLNNNINSENSSYVSNLCKVILGPVYFYKFGSKILHYKP